MAFSLLGLWWAVAAVQTPANTAQLVNAPILARSVAKGEILDAADFTEAALPASAARSAVAPSEAAGQEALRALRAGQPLRPSDIGAPRIIKRGQMVTILFQSGPLSIHAAGRALSDARAGQDVRVVNLSSNRTLDAMADEQGRARVMTQ